MISIPGLGLPGLNLSSKPIDHLFALQSTTTRTQSLAPTTEYRFEVGTSRQLTISLLSGTAELFGTELAPSSSYTFRGTKACIFTWHGCELEVTGDAESEYVAEETQMTSAANVHFALEALRDKAQQAGDIGPRVLVLGQENAGKTALVKTLTAYAVKCGRQPVVVNLDPTQGMLSVPGSLSAAAFSSILDVEEGWGSSPISGPSAVPVKMPLVYHYGMRDPEEGKVFRPLVTRVALAVTSRLEEDRESKHAGLVVDTPGGISQGKAAVYRNIEHIISEFSVNVLLIIGSERLYSDLSRKYANLPANAEQIHIIRLDKSGGCVDRSEDFMKAFRNTQIKGYFFGPGEMNLAPNTFAADYGELNVFRVVDASSQNAAFAPGDDDEEVYGSSKGIYEKVAPGPDMVNKLLAITSAAASDSQEDIRDASVRGYLYVADIDEAKRRVKLLSPQPGHVPPNALVMGLFPEDVPTLVG